MTTTIIGIALAVAAAGLLLPRILSALRTYLALRGKRLITCPETRRTEAVRVASTNAAVGQFFGSTHICLDQCSRWPERELRAGVSAAD
jgi:hypothetical protein